MPPQTGCDGKYPRELVVAVLHHNLGASIDEVNIGCVFVWGVEIFEVLWSHS